MKTLDRDVDSFREADASLWFPYTSLHNYNGFPYDGPCGRYYAGYYRADDGDYRLVINREQRSNEPDILSVSFAVYTENFDEHSYVLGLELVKMPGELCVYRVTKASKIE